MPKKTEKKKDWTKVDVKDIKKHLPKILLFSIILLPLVFVVYFVGYLWSDMQNAHTSNSGVTTDTKTYGVHTENKTSEANKTGTVSDTDFSNTTDLLKLFLSWFPLLFILYLSVKVFGFLTDRD
jgi:hypothetical protein